MSLLTSAVYPALDRLVEPPERVTTYTLSRAGAGWTLVTRERGSAWPGWATPLAPHGAGPDASPRVARAVVVRVLHELGVEVTGWSTGDGTTADTLAETTVGPARTPLRLRGH